jgi:hypothetical protein
VTFGTQGLPQCRLRHGALGLEIGAPSITQGMACSHNAIRTRMRAPIETRGKYRC